MTAKFYIDGKKATKKAVIALVGKDRLDRWVKESEETFREDPCIANDYWCGKMVSIVF